MYYNIEWVGWQGGAGSSSSIIKNTESDDSVFFMAGMAGFEPANDGTKTRCLTTWRHPNSVILAQKLQER